MIPYAWKKSGPMWKPFSAGLGMEAKLSITWAGPS
jgi:hypothetical protein